MDFMTAVRMFFARYADFKGRSRRSEYWWPQLAFFVAYLVIGFIAGMLGEIGGILIIVFYLAMLVPLIAVGVRRLHDLDKSGWWLLISLIPFAGLYLLYLFVQEGTRGPNQYGPDPKGNVGDTFA